MSRHLFVYGTLRRNATNEYAVLLRSAGRFLEEGRTRGRLYRIRDYPGMVVSTRDDDWVRGEVYELHTPATLYGALDAYEGCRSSDPPPHEFRREVRPVLLDSGDWISADVYVYARGVEGKPRIRSGDYFS